MSEPQKHYHAKKWIFSQEVFRFSNTLVRAHDYHGEHRLPYRELGVDVGYGTSFGECFYSGTQEEGGHCHCPRIHHTNKPSRNKIEDIIIGLVQRYRGISDVDQPDQSQREADPHSVYRPEKSPFLWNCRKERKSLLVLRSTKTPWEGQTPLVVRYYKHYTQASKHALQPHGLHQSKHIQAKGKPHWHSQHVE